MRKVRAEITGGPKLCGERPGLRTSERAGKRYWWLSEFRKRRSGAAERYIAGFFQAARNNIVRGHIHRAALIRQDGLIQAKDGDRVARLTALAEDAEVPLGLLWHVDEVLAELPLRLQLVMSGQDLPWTA